ncbi:MAG: sensor histidine kinase, partial [Acidimicrobiales bacterium]
MTGPERWLQPSTPGLSWLSALVRLAALGAVVYFLAASPASTGREPWVVLLVVVASAGWLGWVASILWPFGSKATCLAVTSIIAVMGIAGGLLVGFAPSGYAEAFPCVAVFVASVQMPPRWSTPASVGVIAIVVLGSEIWSAPAGGLAQASLIPVGVFLAGLNRRQFRLRALEEANAAALAERARIARELHDVLAHSLAGLTVQLEAARALLAGHSDPSRALAHVERAHRLGVDGLTEARQAVAALREDTPPLPDLLHALVESHGPDAKLAVRGTPRRLPPDASLTLYRAAQEALTNASRHAPGATVQLVL